MKLPDAISKVDMEEKRNTETKGEERDQNKTRNP